MLTHEQALKKILRHTPRLKAQYLPLVDCFGQVLAQNGEAPFSFPSFDNSAVDGFAINLHLTPPPGRGRKKEGVFIYRGEIAAGDFYPASLKSGEAIRIFTGAVVPKGTYAVVMQEVAQRVNGSVLISRQPEHQENIRFRGEDFPKGRVLVKKGTCLEPQHLGVLAAAGYEKVSVYPQPQVAIFATGNELVPPSSPPPAKRGEEKGGGLPSGKIYDSNTPLLHAMVRKTGGIPVILSKTGDSLNQIRRTIRKGLKNDVLIICGGVSVGKYDFVKQALKEEGVREIFWKVDIKPGKPLFFGKKGQTCIFGLPGNPVSVFITFEEFVKPALLKMQGKMPQAQLREGVLTKPFSNGSRLHFVRVQYRGCRVTPLKGKGSHQVGTLAQANAILTVKPHAVLKKNQKVKVKMITGGAYA